MNSEGCGSSIESSGGFGGGVHHLCVVNQCNEMQVYDYKKCGIVQ
jgi:hypothetical protein